ncbi:MAG: family 78 glycoside hydrolase catalytic domain, partial [Opitutaceae bacterium]|nr:family 78 glycoside hydrolase catalytic domain [Opitutaceae bacterium]
MFRIGTTISKTRAVIFCFSVHLSAVLLLIAPAFAPTLRAALTVDTLRCENLDNPLGIDAENPRLSWRLHSPERGEIQTACEILAATTAERLARDQADLWNSGRITSPETLNIPYGGRPLATSQQVFWKVRVWSNDPAARPSPWSATATFTMGVLDTPPDTPLGPGAHWITDPALLPWVRKTLGFASREAKKENTTKWVQLDLGQSRPIETIILHAITHTLQERYGFPLRFKVEASDDPAFKKPARIALLSDNTANDISSWINVVTIPVATTPGAPPLTARHIRVTATKLRAPDDGKPCLAFSQIEVLAGGKNIALNATVTASDTSDDTARWSPSAVVDGLDNTTQNPRANATLLLRRELTVRPGLVRALAHLTGLGHYEFSANGARISPGLLTPGWTNTAKTILYDTYDITHNLREGTNILSLVLAGGFHNIQDDPQGRYNKFTTPYRPPAACGQIRLEYDDGLVDTINTDNTWRAAPGPTTYANIYGGEDHDARLEPRGWAEPGFDDRDWTPAVPAAPPAGKFRGATLATAPFKHFETLAPVSEKQIRPGLSVTDFGQNASMMPTLRVRGPAGAIVRLTPSELTDAGGAIDRRSAGSRQAWWQYTLRGDPLGETWTPSFFYHGARYLQIERIAPDTAAALPDIEKLESLVTHSDTPPAGDFACSNDLFNRIRALVRWAQRSNLAHVLTDCPHRERLGWLEQYYLNGPALRYEWAVSRLYAKSFQDMADAQTPAGLIPDTAPDYTIFSGAFRDSPEWGSALILAAWQHYLWTAETKHLRAHFDAMDDYADHLGARARKHLLTHGLGDWFDVGPKRPGAAQLTPVALTATATYHETISTLSRIAAVIGRNDDATRLAKDAAKIADAFNRAFLNNDGSPGYNPRKNNPRAATYATGSQTAQAMPLALGLVPKERRAAALDTLVSNIHSCDDTATSGDIGYRYLLRALADNGRSDLIAKMLNQSARPGYAWQLAHGVTSLAESWDARPTTSQNHFMLGQITEWFYGDLAGLQPDPEGPGFRKILIKP